MTADTVQRNSEPAVCGYPAVLNIWGLQFFKTTYQNVGYLKRRIIKDNFPLS
jgi:hypothetical protein